MCPSAQNILNKAWHCRSILQVDVLVNTSITQFLNFSSCFALLAFDFGEAFFTKFENIKLVHESVLH